MSSSTSLLATELPVKPAGGYPDVAFANFIFNLLFIYLDR